MHQVRAVYKHCYLQLYIVHGVFRGICNMYYSLSTCRVITDINLYYARGNMCSINYIYVGTSINRISNIM